MENKNHRPKWLKEIQYNSWNPELIISGFSIVLIYQISDRVGDYAIYWVQNSSINPYLFFATNLYVSLAFLALKILFALHLILRGVWVGFVGISYVFPLGIDWSKLPDFAKVDYVRKQYRDTTDLVLRLEKICSSIFSLAFVSVGVSFSIVTVFLFAMLVDLLGVNIFWNLGIVLSIFFLFSASLPLDYYLSRAFGVKSIKPLRWMYLGYIKFLSFFMIKEPFALFQTNLNKYLSIVGFLLFFMFMGFWTGQALQTTVRFFDRIEKDGIFGLSGGEEKPFRLLSSDYRDRAEGNRIHLARIPSYQMQEDILTLEIARFDVDSKVFDLLGADSSKMRDTFSKTVTIYIDDRSLDHLSWYRAEGVDTNQEVWMSTLMIDSLAKGEHRLRIDKIIWDHIEKDSAHVKNWAVIPFFKH